MTFARMVIVVLMALCGRPVVVQEPPPLADHHMHIRSEAMARAITRAQEAMNERALPSALTSLGAAQVLAALDSAGVSRAAVLSSAYLFGMPDVTFNDRQALVQAENDYVSREVARRPDRLKGFCSINPLADYAMAEIVRCRTLPGMVGIKLHLANSDVDLRNRQHVERLKEIFREAQQSRRPIIVHLRTRRRDYGREDAGIFIREVLREAPAVTVQIAHMAGGGGSYDDATDQALGAFAEALQAGTVRRERILFELSGVVYPPPVAAESGATVRRSHRRLATRIKEIGPDRVVFGSDWDVISVGTSIADLREHLPLASGDLRTIMKNCADYLK